MTLLLFLVHLAAAAQLEFSTSAGAREQTFHYTWQDDAGARHTVDFRLPVAPVARDLAEPVRVPLRVLAEAQAAAVSQYARGVKGPTVKARARSGGRVEILVSGRDRGRMKTALVGAEAARDEARADWLERHRWTTDRKGRLRPDHPRVAAEYAELLRPVAEALGMLDRPPREGLALALSFVQSIRYERASRSRKDAGFRRPLALLAANRGDCDGKTTLFLGLARAAYPDLAVAVAYIPHHAFAGVALPVERGDHSFRRNQVRYVMAEPVGPAQSPLGTGGPTSMRRATLGLLEVVPVP